jgi:hypothetical protein
MEIKSILATHQIICVLPSSYFRCKSQTLGTKGTLSAKPVMAGFQGLASVTLILLPKSPPRLLRSRCFNRLLVN